MRVLTACIWVALLSAVAPASAQKIGPQRPKARPIKVPTAIRGAMEHTPEELHALVRAGLTTAQEKQLNAVVAALKAGQRAGAQELWMSFVRDLVEQARADGINAQLLMVLQAPGSGSAEPANRSNLAGGDRALIEAAFGLPAGSLGSTGSLDAIVQYALSAAYVSPNPDLAGYARQVSVLARPIRELLTHGYSIQSRLDPDDLEASWGKAQETEAEFLASLGLPDQVPPEGVETPDDLEALLEAWDEELQTIGEDAQLANVDMQSMLQKQQQTIQMMSQISKMLHDLAMAVIRKMGG